MIRNVVFDFGQVLIRFEPKYMVEQYVTNPEDSALLQQVVFDRAYWDLLDWGKISDEETVAKCKERLPARLHDAAEKIYYNWIYHLPEIEGMRELIADLRQEFGAGIFLLSNISTYFSSHRDEIPILSEIDRCVFSAECGMVKPSAEIFAHLCKVCEIKKEETVFIDDNEKNVCGAERFGIRAYLFDGDVKTLKKWLWSMLQAK